jgi:hypothetical protein
VRLFGFPGERWQRLSDLADRRLGDRPTQRGEARDRRPHHGTELASHITADAPARRSQFAWSFAQTLKHREPLGSIETVDDYFDNAPMESIWGSMQIELLNRDTWMTYIELAPAMDYIINFFHSLLRRDSSLECLTPHEFEALSSDSKPPLSRPSANKRGQAQVSLFATRTDWQDSASPRGIGRPAPSIASDRRRLEVPDGTRPSQR